MKKITLCVVTALLLSTTIQAQTQTKSEPVATSLVANKADESAKAGVLLARLDKINTMDKSTLSSGEKKQLRKEVRTIKSTLNEMGGGVYVSVGAIIIILLLLIILL